MFVNINSSTAHGTNYLGILGFARLPCSAKCSRLCWTRNIPCCRSPAVVQGKRPHFLRKEEDLTREIGRNQAYPCNIFSLVNQLGNNDVIFIIFNRFFFSNITATTLVIMAKNQKPIHTLTPQAPQHRSKPSCKKQIILI